MTGGRRCCFAFAGLTGTSARHIRWNPTSTGAPAPDRCLRAPRLANLDPSSPSSGSRLPRGRRRHPRTTWPPPTGTVAGTPRPWRTPGRSDPRRRRRVPDPGRPGAHHPGGRLHRPGRPRPGDRARPPCAGAAPPDRPPPRPRPRPDHPRPRPAAHRRRRRRHDPMAAGVRAPGRPRQPRSQPGPVLLDSPAEGSPGRGWSWLRRSFIEASARRRMVAP
jgi:hypothetical protein